MKPNLKYAMLVSLTNDVTEPSCYSKAAKNPNWCLAMQEELAALEKNETWDLVPYISSMNVLPNNQTIPCSVMQTMASSSFFSST